MNRGDILWFLHNQSLSYRSEQLPNVKTFPKLCAAVFYRKISQSHCWSKCNSSGNHPSQCITPSHECKPEVPFKLKLHKLLTRCLRFPCICSCQNGLCCGWYEIGFTLLHSRQASCLLISLMVTKRLSSIHLNWSFSEIKKMSVSKMYTYTTSG